MSLTEPECEMWVNKIRHKCDEDVKYIPGVLHKEYNVDETTTDRCNI